MSHPTPAAQPQQHPSIPQGPYPGTPEAARRRGWFARHKILTGLGAFVVFVIVVSAIGGGGADEPSGDAGQAAGEVVSAPGSDADAEPADAAAEQPAAAAIGTPVRDGKLEFTVTAVEPGVASLGSDTFGQKAQGQFVLVRVTVQNIGDEAVFFHGGSQKAFDAQGREFSPDATAPIYLEDANSFLNEINPGNTVNGTVVFDMPVDVAITSLELHDSPFSSGVAVTL